MTFFVAVQMLRLKLWHWLLALVLTVPGGMLLNVVLKIVFHRPRPVFTDPMVSFSGYSFPSGHTMSTTLFYGVLSWLAIRQIKAWYWRVVVISGGGFMVVFVAFSRIYLGAHYLSDVLGAIAEGLAWLAVCLTTIEAMRRHRMSKRLANARRR
jgi:membrane-associated phospholipid phosphatase